MKNILSIAAAVALASASCFAGAKPKDTVAFAPNWDDAVSMAKLLNVPLVVHSHGWH